MSVVLFPQRLEGEERPDLEGMREVSAPEGSPVTWRYRGEPPPSHEATAFGLLGVVPLLWGDHPPQPTESVGVFFLYSVPGQWMPTRSQSIRGYSGDPIQELHRRIKWGMCLGEGRMSSPLL